MRDVLVRVLGWRALMLHGDPCVWDRYWWLRSRLRRPGQRVLDAGAGNGGFAIFAARMGNESLGLSFSADEMSAAKRRAAICHAESARFAIRDLRTLGDGVSPEGQFDEIICFEVIEHLLDDAKLVRELAAMLRPGGRLLITAPYLPHRPLLGEQLSETEDGGHVRWGYSEERLRSLAQHAALDVVEIGYVSGVISQRLTNLQRRLGRLSQALGWGLTLPLRLLSPLDRRLTAILRYPYLSISLVARRPG
jgi:SAM-dependent methyltransferase